MVRDTFWSLDDIAPRLFIRRKPPVYQRYAWNLKRIPVSQCSEYSRFWIRIRHVPVLVGFVFLLSHPSATCPSCDQSRDKKNWDSIHIKCCPPPSAWIGSRLPLHCHVMSSQASPLPPATYLSSRQSYTFSVMPHPRRRLSVILLNRILCWVICEV